MSGVGAPGRAPRTDAELLLSVVTRLRRVEARVGKARNTTVVDGDGNEVDSEQLTLGRGQFRALDAVLESQGVTADSDPTVIKSTFERLLNPDSPLDSYKLNGAPPRSFFDLIPVSSIGPAESNLLANPHFIGADSLLGLDEWEHDATRTHSTVDGAGSARTELTGAARELGSNPISVVPGQKVPLRIYVAWEGVTLAQPGRFITLIAQCYQDGLLVHDQVLGTAGTAGDSPDWSELRGEYTVPREVDNTAVAPDEVRMLVRIEANPSGGTVWVSDGWMSKNTMPGMFPADAVDTLPESLSILDESGQMVIAVLIKALTGNPILGWAFRDLEDEIASWFDDTQVTAGRADDAWTDIRETIGAIVRSVFGDDGNYDDTSPEGAREALDTVNRTLTKHTRTLQEMQARDAGESASGVIIDIDFSEYPDGPLTPAGFTVSYTGPGTSLLVIKSGKAQWDKLDNRNRDAWVLYNAPTATNFQILRGTMSSPPEDTEDGGRPHFYALGRVSSPAAQAADGGISDVWVRAWSVGTLFLYRGDIGQHKAGIEYVWASNIPLTWSLDMTYVVGVGVIERQYQVFSGNKLVFSYEESPSQPGGLSNLAEDTFDTDGQRIVDDRYRGWGSLAQLRRAGSGKPHSGGVVAGCSVADNELPAVVGSTAMMYRTNTSGVGIQGGSVDTGIPTNFWEFVGRASRDIRPNTGGGYFTVTRTDSYSIKGRVKLGGTYIATMLLLLQLRKGGTGDWVTIGWGQWMSHPDSSKAALSGAWDEQLEAGDQVRLATWSNGLSVNGGLVGEATGTESKFSITGFGGKVA